MIQPSIPLMFAPIFKPKPWGGRQLATLLNKSLPQGDPIGESWELADLPGNESRVHHGPLAGRTLNELVQMWGRALLGNAPLVDRRFPLLIKFLDARDNLSVQVHPKPTGADPGRFDAGVKHEAWYIVHAEPGARAYIGLKPGVTPRDLAQAANTPHIVDLLHAWDATRGQCFYLPSGTPHALGAGIVAAEVQTPSDVTYRLYDWDRVDAAGRPRELHIEAALANVRYDIRDNEIAQPPMRHRAELYELNRVAACDRFQVDVVRLLPGRAVEILGNRMRIWIILAGKGHVKRERYDSSHDCHCGPGDVVLIPADAEPIGFDMEEDAEFLEVSVPV